MSNIIETYLPNFRYIIKDGNGIIVFKLKTPFKIDVNKKTIWINDFELKEIKMYNKIDYEYGDIAYRIFEEEFEKGLKIKIYDTNNIHDSSIHEIIKNIEIQLLNINIHDTKNNDNNNKSNDNDFTVFNKRRSPSNFKKELKYTDYGSDNDSY